MIKTPIAMNPLKNILSVICNDGKLRRERGLPIPPLMMQLDANNGQTTVVNYIADYFEKSHRLCFSNLDRVVELKVNSFSLKSTAELFYQIDSYCVYTNPADGFDGVISIDISDLKYHLEEPQFEYFCKNIQFRSNTAFIFFVDTDNSDDTKKLMTEIQRHIPSVRYVNIPKYSTTDLAYIAEKIAKDYGVTLESEETINILKNLIESCQLYTAKAVSNLICEVIMSLPDTDIITTASLNSLYKNIKRGY